MVQRTRRAEVPGESTGVALPTVPTPPGSRPPLVVSFVGSSGVGKTSLIETLVPLLQSEGLRVGTVKHAPHGFDADKRSSDSWRHRVAGAELVLLSGGGTGVLFVGPPDRDTGGDRHHAPGLGSDSAHTGRLVQEHMGAMDVVLVEGFVAVSDRLVKLTRSGIEDKAQSGRERTWLVVTDAADRGPDVFAFDQAPALAARIAQECGATASPDERTIDG